MYLANMQGQSIENLYIIYAACCESNYEAAISIACFHTISWWFLYDCLLVHGN
jgi:hypothetical protein